MGLGSGSSPNPAIIAIVLAICFCWVPYFIILSLYKCGRRRLRTYREEHGWVPDPAMQQHPVQTLMPQLRIPERLAAQQSKDRDKEKDLESESNSNSTSAAGLSPNANSAHSDSIARSGGETKFYRSHSRPSKHSRGTREGGNSTKQSSSAASRRNSRHPPSIMSVMGGFEAWQPIAAKAQTQTASFNEDQYRELTGWKGKMPDRSGEPLPIWHFPTSDQWHELKNGMEVAKHVSKHVSKDASSEGSRGNGHAGTQDAESKGESSAQGSSS